MHLMLILFTYLIGVMFVKGDSSRSWANNRPVPVSDFVAQYAQDSSACFNSPNVEQCHRRYDRADRGSSSRNRILDFTSTHPLQSTNTKTNFIQNPKLDSPDNDLDELLTSDGVNDSVDFTDFEQTIPETLLDDLRSMNDKRSNQNHNIGCDCKIKNDLVDLGYTHFPRYLINAVCHSDEDLKSHPGRKCFRGSRCKPVEYKVRVLAYRSNKEELDNDSMALLLPDNMRPYWKFKTVTVAAGCFCSL